MGSNIVGSTRITYYTKDKIPIEYIYYDLKGRNRFPPIPSDDKYSTLCLTQSKKCSSIPSITLRPLTNSWKS